MSEDELPIRWIRIAGFVDALSARIASGRLESEGIPVTVLNEQFLTANWLMSSAVGGVQVLVPAEPADIARQLLSQHARVVGAKHPLLSMCCDELRSAWGAQTRFVWSWRPLEDSIAGLTHRRWFPGHEAVVQTGLWNRLNVFEADANTLLKLDWRDAQRDPHATAQRLSSWLGLDADTDRIARAAAFVRIDPA